MLQDSCGVTFVGNVHAEGARAVGTATWRYNVFQDDGGQVPCGSTNKLVNGTRYGWSALGLSADLHLLSGSPAINAGDRTQYPPRPIAMASHAQWAARPTPAPTRSRRAHKAPRRRRRNPEYRPDLSERPGTSSPEGFPSSGPHPAVSVHRLLDTV